MQEGLFEYLTRNKDALGMIGAAFIVVCGAIWAVFIYAYPADHKKDDTSRKGKVNIIEASFVGDDGGKSTPVTPVLSNQCNGLKHCSFDCTQGFLGETLVGTHKHCVVFYSCDGTGNRQRTDAKELEVNHIISCSH